MILKKPYALLIKHFRTIHIILTLLMCFIVYECSIIVGFFSDFVSNNYNITITSNLASEYINGFLYISIIAVIIALIGVFVLLAAKKKPNKLYLISIIYYVILIIFIAIAGNLISGLEQKLWETAAARTYRDLAYIIYYPQYILIILIGVRALGFNVKQFNFKSDLKDMEITESDSEEIELSLNFQTYKAERTIRRSIRELKYYFLENKFIIIVISVITIIVIGYISIKNYEKINYIYKENSVVYYSGLQITVTDSMVTNIDLKGNKIYKDKYFVVIKFNVKNGNKANKDFDYDSLKLYYNNAFVYPSLDLGEYFKDFGTPYMGNILKAGADETYIMPYMIDEKDKNSSFEIGLYLGSAANKEEFVPKTAKIKLNPIKIKDVETITIADIGDTVSFASSTIKESSLKIDSVLFTNRYEYEYEYCFKYADCTTRTGVVNVDNMYQKKQTLIVMDYELVLDKTTPSYTKINNAHGFTDAFVEVEYEINDVIVKVPVKYKSPSELKNKLVLQTDGTLLKSKTINLLITIRDRNYKIKLKDDK